MRPLFELSTCVAGALCLRASFENFLLGKHSVSSVFLAVALLNAYSFVSSRSRT